MNEVEVKIGADATPMEPGVAKAKSEVAGVGAAAQDMGKAFSGVSAGVAESFSGIATGAANAGSAVKGSLAGIAPAVGALKGEFDALKISVADAFAPPVNGVTLSAEQAAAAIAGESAQLDQLITTIQGETAARAQATAAVEGYNAGVATENRLLAEGIELTEAQGLAIRRTSAQTAQFLQRGIVLTDEQIGALQLVNQAWAEQGAAAMGAASETEAASRRAVSAIHQEENAVEKLHLKIKGTLGPIRAMREAFSGIGEVILAAFAVEAIRSWAEHQGEAAEKVDQLSQKVGLSKREIVQWSNVAAYAHMDADQFVSSIGKLDKALVMAASGGKTQAAAFRAIGIESTRSLGSQEALLRVADSFSKMPDGPKKYALAVALMGKSGAAMIPVLNAGRDALREQMEEAEKLGATWGRTDAEQEAFIAKGLRMDDALDNLSLGFKGISNAIFDDFGPSLAASVEGLVSLAEAFVESYRQGGLAKTAIDALVVSFDVVVTAVAAVGTGFIQMWHVAVGSIQAIFGPLVALGMLIEDVFSGNMANASANFQRNMRLNTQIVVEEFAKARNAGIAYSQFMGKLWSGQPAGAAKPKLKGGVDNYVPGLGGAGAKGPKGPSDVDRWKTELADKLALEENFGADVDKITLDFWTQKLALTKKGSQAELQIHREIARVKRQIMAGDLREQVADAQQAANLKVGILKGEMDAQREAIAQEEELLNQKRARGQISATETERQRAVLHAKLRQMEIDEEEAEFKIKVEGLIRERDLKGQTIEARAALHRELERMEVEHQARMAGLEAKKQTGGLQDRGQVDDAKRSGVTSWVSPVVGAWTSGLQAMEGATGNFRQTVLGMFDAIAQTAIAKVGQMVQNWIVNHIIMRTVSTAAKTAEVGTTIAAESAKVGVVAAGQAGQVAATAAGTTAATGITVAGALTQIGAHAATAAAGAYAALAAIPIIGPVIAPLAAVAALAAVLALGKSIFSAEDGWGDVPYDGATTKLHKREMVLPASIATPLRDSLKGGFSLPGGLGGQAGASAAGDALRGALQAKAGDTALTYAPNITNPDPDLERMLATQARSLRKWMRNELRGTVAVRGGKG